MGEVADCIVGAQGTYPGGLFPPPLIDQDKYRRATQNEYPQKELVATHWHTLCDWQSFPAGAGECSFFFYMAPDNGPFIKRDYVKNKMVVDRGEWRHFKQHDGIHEGMAIWQVELVGIAGLEGHLCSVDIDGWPHALSAFQGSGDRRSYSFHSPRAAIWKEGYNSRFLRLRYCSDRPCTVSALVHGYFLKKVYRTQT